MRESNRVYGVRFAHTALFVVDLRCCGQDLELEHHRHTFPHTSIRPDHRIVDTFRFMESILQAAAPDAIVVASLTPGVRLRSTSVERLQAEGSIILSAALNRITRVRSASHHQIKKEFPLFRRSAKSAFDTIYLQMDLEKKHDQPSPLPRNPFVLEAFGAALFGLKLTGRQPPDWTTTLGNSG